MEEDINQPPANREETGRNPDGTFKSGFSGNPNGRPRNPLKTFSLKEFNEWTDDEKRDFLSKISPIDRWKMTEGNPDSKIDSDITTKGDKIELSEGSLKLIKEYEEKLKEFKIK